MKTTHENKSTVVLKWSPKGADKVGMIKIDFNKIPAKYKGVTDRMQDAGNITLFLLMVCTNKEVLAMSQLVKAKGVNSLVA